MCSQISRERIKTTSLLVVISLLSYPQNKHRASLTMYTTMLKQIIYLSVSSALISRSTKVRT